MNKFITKIVGAALGLTMAIGVGVAVGVNNSEAREVDAATTTYTFNSSIPTTGWTSSGGSKTINSVSWTYSNCTYIGATAAKIQIGSKNNPQTSAWTISTAVSNFFVSGKKITSIAITAYTTATTATYGISAGGSSVKSGSLTTSSSTYTASSLDVTSGNIIVTMTGSSTSKAMYLENISVTYEDASVEPSITFNDSTLDLKTNNSSGVTKTVTTANITNVEYLWSTEATNVLLENETTSTVTIKPNTVSAGNATINLLVTGDNIDDFEDSFTVNLVLPASYTITITATNCTYSGDSTILESDEATITFTPSAGYNLPGSLSPVGASVKSWNPVSGVLVLQNPSSNVTLTVTAAQYKNNVANIVSGGQYKIYHTVDDVKYYMSAPISTTNQPVYTTNAWEATIFTFTLVGDNTISISQGVNYLYNTDTNNGMRFNVTSTTTWVLSAGTHYDSTSDKAVSDGAGYYNLCGSNDRYLALYMGQSSNTPTDFRCYTFNYDSNKCNKARLSATQFEYYDASAFAQDILDATDTVCSTASPHTSSDFSTLWTKLENNYGYLASSDKTSFGNAEANKLGTTIEKSAARYDRLVGKYSLKNFATGRLPSAGAKVAGIETTANSSTTLFIILVTSISLVAVSSYFVIRRRREN